VCIIERLNKHLPPKLAELRHALWPRLTVEHHGEELFGKLTLQDSYAVFVATEPDGMISGFAEASLRFDYVNGCTSSPVAFMEGIYVMPEYRGRGVARALADGCAHWGAATGAKELASDAAITNLESLKMHQALGFEETERVVYFKKQLP
jgi:aminoglycoside 6'-N-acetyltransferase I